MLFQTFILRFYLLALVYHDSFFFSFYRTSVLYNFHLAYFVKKKSFRIFHMLQNSCHCSLLFTQLSIFCNVVNEQAINVPCSVFFHAVLCLLCLHFCFASLLCLLLFFILFFIFFVAIQFIVLSSLPCLSVYFYSVKHVFSNLVFLKFL